VFLLVVVVFFFLFLCCIFQIDLEEKTAKNWYHPGGIPTEPFFVPRPGAVAEDDGKFTQN
jgi:carotenoid cleavage dioxygenase-like enzyme